jgi:precorrin-6Y C5,15-methyltransferase (decarboxylating)
LQLLELKPNMALWDIGAGSGSISVDAHKTYKIKSILFEKDENRCKYIVQNLQNHNILGAKLHIGSALENIQNETTNPDRIFMGGGGTELIQNLESVLNRLKPNGIFVAAIVSLANLSQIINKLDALNIVYDVKALSLTTYKTKLQISEPERQIFLLKVIK